MDSKAYQKLGPHEPKSHLARRREQRGGRRQDATAAPGVQPDSGHRCLLGEPSIQSQEPNDQMD